MVGCCDALESLDISYDRVYHHYGPSDVLWGLELVLSVLTLRFLIF